MAGWLLYWWKLETVNEWESAHTPQVHWGAGWLSAQCKREIYFTFWARRRCLGRAGALRAWASQEGEGAEGHGQRGKHWSFCSWGRVPSEVQFQRTPGSSRQPAVTTLERRWKCWLISQADHILISKSKLGFFSFLFSLEGEPEGSQELFKHLSTGRERSPSGNAI